MIAGFINVVRGVAEMETKYLLDKRHYLPQIHSASLLLILLYVRLINSCLAEECTNNRHWKCVSEGGREGSVVWAAGENLPNQNLVSDPVVISLGDNLAQIVPPF